MAQFEPYLFFDGTCAEAMRFYERTLGGKLDLMKAGDSPEACDMTPDAADKILHARLALGDRAVMASDWMGGGQPYEGMKGFSLALAYPAVDEAQRVFDALAEGGQVIMPMGKTFWVESFGMLVDRFGTPWFVSGGAPSMGA
jgi:PhnB protein